MGSRDRRLYRELVYTALRYLPWIEPLLDEDPAGAVRRMAWLATDTPEVGLFRSEMAGGLPPCPEGTDDKASVLGADAASLTPQWLRQECPEAFVPPLRELLLTRAPLWVRLQTEEPASVLAEFDALGWAWKASPLVERAIRLPVGAAVERTDAYRAGKIEVQDIGSQRVLHCAGVAPETSWLDACAGAGGKTLQLAAMAGPGGRVVARDVRREALDELAARAERAGMAGAIAIGAEGDPPEGYDGVLVDVPCSGSGTWRRAPHLKWVAPQLAPTLQLRLLSENASRVRRGGIVVYATCSLCRSENESVTEAFAATAEGFEAVIAGRNLRPQEHDGDGFYVAVFRRA